MAFPISVSDVYSLIQVTNRVYQGWKSACGEYTDITQQLESLRIILSQVALEVKSPTLLLLHHDQDLSQLKVVVSNCEDIVYQLEDVVRSYKGIAISRRRTWNRIRLGQENLSGLREKLTLQITALGTYLGVLGFRTLGRIEDYVKDLPEMKKVIDGLAAEFRAGRREESVMTSYTNDEKEVWRRF